jgi:hypothetical protein
MYTDRGIISRCCNVKINYTEAGPSRLVQHNCVHLFSADGHFETRNWLPAAPIEESPGFTQFLQANARIIALKDATAALSKS